MVGIVSGASRCASDKATIVMEVSELKNLIECEVGRSCCLAKSWLYLVRIEVLVIMTMASCVGQKSPVKEDRKGGRLRAWI